MEIDYKEKYEQAMEKARQFFKKPYLEDSAGIVGYIFPELKESEDERIRKALKEYFINSFQNNGVAAICGVHIKEILAWLEKQGEKGTKGNEREIPNSAWSEEEIENCAREAEDNNCIILAKHIRQLKSLRPQSQWKPSNKCIEALEKVLKYFHLSKAHGKTIDGLEESLEQLLNQLKKLREE